jgi:protein NrfC
MPEKKKKIEGVSRRDFLKYGTLAAGTLISSTALLAACATEATTETETKTLTKTETATKTATATATTTKTETVEVPFKAAVSTGYLVYDSRKCAGCVTCMASCSLVHEGEVNLSLARIQIAQNSFGKFPDDIQMAICRQCETPLCVQNCPTGACHVDEANGNVRVIDQDLCIGCKTCLAACPYEPHRTIWDAVKRKATKCDLCINTPYWDETGGPGGKQACVEACPMKALSVVTAMPDQEEWDGYDVNLRTDNWMVMGLAEDMEAYYITIMAGQNGSIAGPGRGTRFIVYPGGSASFTITPSEGYKVADVTVDGNSVGAVTSYTFENVTAGHILAATFAATG